VRYGWETSAQVLDNEVAPAPQSGRDIKARVFAAIRRRLVSCRQTIGSNDLSFLNETFAGNIRRRVLHLGHSLQYRFMESGAGFDLSSADEKVSGPFSIDIWRGSV
jgi:hypothetical protein